MNMDIKYRQFKTSDKKNVSELIKCLYIEDSEGKPISDEKINKTFNELLKYPEKGSIIVIEEEETMIGYCILINFWSNEDGGNILNINELYIEPDYRGNKIATNFIRYLIENRCSNAVALQLEVKLSNIKAKILYERIGFKLSKSKYFTYDFKE